MTEAGDPRIPDEQCAWCGREKALGFATISPSLTDETKRYCHGDQERPTCYEMAQRSMFRSESIFPRFRDDGLVGLKQSISDMEKQVRKVSEQMLLISLRMEQMDLE